MHRMPQIGELGPGVWLASGFGGHGLNTTAMAGNIIARAIVEGDQTWRQFTPFELVWAGGVFGRVAAQMRVWIKRLRDRIEERRAKARELAQRQAREAQLTRLAKPSMVQEQLPAQPATVDSSVYQAAATSDSTAVLAADVAEPEQPAVTADSIIPSAGNADRAAQPQTGAAERRPKRRKRRNWTKHSAGRAAKT